MEAIDHIIKNDLLILPAGGRGLYLNADRVLPGFDAVSPDAAFGSRAETQGIYDCVLVRGTKQAEETLGLVAQAVRHAGPAARIIVAQSNDQGAQSLEKTLKAAGAQIVTQSKAKARIMAFSPQNVKTSDWEEKAAMQPVLDGAYQSQPGLFSWNRIDPGSFLLMQALPDNLPGTGADFGCGWGFLTRHLVNKADMVYAVDNDARAIAAVTVNVPSSKPVWADATRPVKDLPPLDWIVSNPPFHGAGGEDRGLGQKFIANAAHHLKRGGVLYLVANRHLPYEKILGDRFAQTTLSTQAQGYKVIAAVK